MQKLLVGRASCNQLRLRRLTLPFDLRGEPNLKIEGRLEPKVLPCATDIRSGVARIARLRVLVVALERSSQELLKRDQHAMHRRRDPPPMLYTDPGTPHSPAEMVPLTASATYVKSRV